MKKSFNELLSLLKAQENNSDKRKKELYNELIGLLKTPQVVGALSGAGISFITWAAIRSALQKRYRLARTIKEKKEILGKIEKLNMIMAALGVASTLGGIYIGNKLE